MALEKSLADSQLSHCSDSLLSSTYVDRLFVGDIDIEFNHRIPAHSSAVLKIEGQAVLEIQTNSSVEQQAHYLFTFPVRLVKGKSLDWYIVQEQNTLESGLIGQYIFGKQTLYLQNKFARKTVVSRL